MPNLLMGARYVLLSALGEPDGAAACSPEAGQLHGSPGQRWDGVVKISH